MKQSILVAFGGNSVEHDISLISAKSIIKCLKEKYRVIPLYFDAKQVMYTYDKDFDVEILNDSDSVKKLFKSCQLVVKNHKYYLAYNYRKLYFDFVLPVFHGHLGEDGCFQGLLDVHEIPYGMSNGLSLACMQDKEMMKHLLQEAGIPSLPWFVWCQHQLLDHHFYQKIQRLGLPVIIKSASLGSSIGIRVVYHQDELYDALQECFRYDHKVIIERYIENAIEYHCGVIGELGRYRYSGIEKISKSQDIFSFEAKYIGNNQVKRCFEDNQVIIDEIQRYARVCMDIFQVQGMIRIDFISDNKEIYVNELNGIPGSYAYHLWEERGVSLEEVLDEIIELGWKRYRNQRMKDYEYHYEGKIKEGIKK